MEKDEHSNFLFGQRGEILFSDDEEQQDCKGHSVSPTFRKGPMYATTTSMMQTTQMNTT